MARAESAGLQYLSESIVSEMLTSTLPPAVARTLERISPDLLHLEQYMDFVCSRQLPGVARSWSTPITRCMNAIPSRDVLTLSNGHRTRDEMVTALGAHGSTPGGRPSMPQLRR